MHLLLNNESMSEGKQVISQNINIGSRRHPCEICLLDFLNHRFTEYRVSPVLTTAVIIQIVIVKMNLFGFESHKCLFCDVFL